MLDAIEQCNECFIPVIKFVFPVSIPIASLLPGLCDSRTRAEVTSSGIDEGSFLYFSSTSDLKLWKFWSNFGQDLSLDARHFDAF